MITFGFTLYKFFQFELQGRLLGLIAFVAVLLRR